MCFDVRVFFFRNCFFLTIFRFLLFSLSAIVYLLFSFEIVSLFAFLLASALVLALVTLRWLWVGI